MEFPDLGKHCSEKTCKQLDFLPLKCDTCEQEFCKDHFARAAHKCPFAFKKDVQVPVCPLCDRPVPVKKGEIPDAVVGEHIDRDCKLRARTEEKVFTYRCSRGGCKKKEMLPVACDQCGGNFCLQHRHPLDHSCVRGRSPISLPGPRQPPFVAAACHWPFGRRRRALASGRCRSRRRDRVTWARRLPEVGVGGHAQDGKTEEESFWSAGEKEEKAEGGGGGRGTGGTRRRRPGLRAGPQGRSCVLRPRADPGAHPGADPGGEEGPGEEAEEGAEEGRAEAASGGGRSPGPAPEGPVLRCPAGPGLPPRLGPKAGGLEISEDAADLAAAAHVRRRPGPGGALPRPAGLPGGAEGPGPRADPAEGRSPDAGAGPGGRRPPGPAPAGEDAARPAGGKRASQGGRVPATRPPIAVASPGCTHKTAGRPFLCGRPFTGGSRDTARPLQLETRLPPSV